MKKTFSIMALSSHDTFTTKQREKRYFKYLRRIEQIIDSEKKQELGILRKSRTVGKHSILTEYQINTANTILYNKLLDISRRNATNLDTPKKAFSIDKWKSKREEEIRMQNERLFQSINRTMNRPTHLIKQPHRLINGHFLKNKRLPLPKLINFQQQ